MKMDNREPESQENISSVETGESVSENNSVLCQNCGAVLTDDHAFCPKCGTPRPKKKVCSKCGAELEEGQAFCSKCGQKVEMEISAGGSEGISQNKAGVDTKEKKSKKSLPIIIAAIVIVAVIAVVFAMKGKAVSEVTLNKNSITIVEGKTGHLVCTVTPDDAKDKTLTWESSNESIATVDEEGTITARAEGSCTVTVSSKNGKTDECKVTVEAAGPDFQNLYRTYCSSVYATVGSDGSYLSIDTNPYDLDDYTTDGSIQAIINVNNALGLPDYVIDDMGSTTALMGRQTETFSDIGVTVSWSYHPDKGLEVTYKAIN